LKAWVELRIRCTLLMDVSPDSGMKQEHSRTEAVWLRVKDLLSERRHRFLRSNDILAWNVERYLKLALHSMGIFATRKARAMTLIALYFQILDCNLCDLDCLRW
jgi:hypothetical protein